MIAHVSGVPVEELLLLVLASGAGAGLLLARRADAGRALSQSDLAETVRQEPAPLAAATTTADNMNVVWSSTSVSQGGCDAVDLLDEGAGVDARVDLSTCFSGEGRGL